MTHDNSYIGTIVHLPECWVSTKRDHRYMTACICTELRACEQRVREDEFLYKGDIDTAYGQGWDEALDAAREAVIRTCHHTKYEGCRLCSHDTALVAIDAIRQPPPPTAHYDPAAKDNRP